MLPLEEPEDVSMRDYTLIIPHEAAVELIHGRVRHDVLVACISAVKAMDETPAEGIATSKRRRKARTERAA